MKRLPTIWLLLLLCCCCREARGQQYIFDYYNSNNGLLNNEVHCIRQSSKGLIYFGTPSGLSIYDGDAFTNYDHTKGFDHEIISDMQELPGKGMLLFTNTDAFYRLERQHLFPGTANPKIAIKNVYPVAADGKWLACSDRGLFLFDNGKLEKLPLYPADSFPLINCVLPCNDSLLLVGRNFRTLDLFNMHTCQRMASSSEKIFVRGLFRDAEGNVWISCIEKGVLKLSKRCLDEGRVDPESITARDPAFQHTEFRSVVQDRSGNLWMGSIGKGLIRYNPVTGEFLPVNTEHGLVSNTIFCLYCDREDNLWIGTNRGIQKLVHKDVLAYSSHNGLPADLVYDMLVLPNRNLATCGISGMAYIGAYGAKIKVLRPPPVDDFFFQFAELGRGNMDPGRRNTELGRGNLDPGRGYYALTDKQLIELGYSRDAFFVKRAYGLPGHFWNMARWGEDELLLGGDSSIASFKHGILKEITHEHVRYTRCICVDEQGILWTGNRNNEINGYQLYRERGRSDEGGQLKPRHLYYYKAPVTGVNDWISCITHDKWGRVAYGTNRGGIHILSLAGGALVPGVTIDQRSGLSANTVNCFLWDNDSVLLTGTGTGLDKIVFTPSGRNFKVHNINSYFNLSGTVYNVRKDSAGNLLVGTESGLYRIPRISNEKAHVEDLPVAISQVRLPDYPDSLIDTEAPLELAHANSAISISYASPAFMNERATRYIYRLEGGRQKNWSAPSFSHQVTFSNLAPGKYRFLVKPVNMYGKVSAEEADFALVIKPEFWQTQWFLFLSALVVGGGAYLLVRRRIGMIRKESSFKTKIAETEMVALRAQMNPHFIFNCMNIIDGLISDNRKTEAKNFLQKFSKLIRLVLENSQYPLVPLEQDIKALKLYVEMEDIRYDHQWDYEFIIDRELSDEHYPIPPLLLQPYVENAIVHGLRHKEDGRGKLLVSIGKEDGRLSVTIEDNGVGRARSAQINEENRKSHQQLGMKVTGQRIALLKAMNPGVIEVSITDLPVDTGGGTRVILRFPLTLKTV